ncbi:MAG: NAD(P)H-hydrate dehydratase [Devosiaceae bacterium]|nr:NAD(P)H-hydrate dehydratase [Devosiaceae bacterium MH13]
MAPMDELLTPEQVGRCDALTIEAGTPGTTLMARAGAGLFEVLKTITDPGTRVLVACGPGNNGGDGYVLAKFLGAAGYHTTVVALSNPANLSGDAAWAHGAWGGLAIDPQVLDHTVYDKQDLIVDALFGAGLARPLDGAAADMVARINGSPAPVLAVDLPSGLDGRTGQPLGPVVKADHTVTFHRLKPGHVLMPGRALCGASAAPQVIDIGIGPEAHRQAGFAARLTGPGLLQALPDATADAHKHSHGHALVLAGPPETAGAGFLAASAALRVGAGLVILGASAAVHGASLGQAPALMRAALDGPKDLARTLDAGRFRACALGPGLPPDEATRQLVYAALASDAPLVLDAGALTAFAGMAAPLFDGIAAREAPVVLTPHLGEFRRLFGDASDAAGSDDPAPSKLEMAQAAAARSGAVVLVKGADTVVADPSGAPEFCFVNASAPLWLATAGSGDVLCGLIAGLLARHHPAVEAAHLVGLAAWLHGAAAMAVGPALVASDMEAGVEAVLAEHAAPFVPIEAMMPIA